ncbi:Transcription factor Adf-1 [Frankliniella fusca]|uniref:Transcription factor Adf-1 n=1 Tax=Frankliniella fusca TaxID=407009 RepID=A0AAE1GW30_9NEOP|nr:Transcription factor Adf-1 [Frankliniella fusca]
MPPKRQCITPEIEIRMISEIQLRPVLWDVTLDIYKRQDLKQHAWEEVASNIGCPELASTLAGRWKNIRETFTSNMKRIRESKRSGVGAADVYVPKWPLFKYLDFLKKTCNQADSESNIPESLTIVHDSSQLFDMNSTSANTTESTQTIYYDENTKQCHAIPADSINSSSESLGLTLSDQSSPLAYILSPSSLHAPPPRPASAPVATTTSSVSTSKALASEPLFERKGSGKKRNYSVMEEAVAVLKEVAQQPPPVIPQAVEVPKQDAFDQFGAFIATRLRAMDPTSSKECENQILSVIISFN